MEVASHIEHNDLYGAGDGKLGSTCTALPFKDRTAANGKILRATIESSTPSLGKLVNGVKIASLRGYLKGIDGRAIMSSVDPSSTRPIKLQDKTFKNPKGIVTKDSLNRLLQGGAAEVFKKAVEILLATTKHLRAESVIYYHDEAQTLVHNDDIEEYIRLVKLSIQQSGEYFKMNIPIDGEIKVGQNWAETH